MENFEAQQFRNNLAKEIAEAPKGERKKILDKAKGTLEYQQARKETKESPKEKIATFLSESLPETESRIAEPMESTCKVSVVIPSYGERELILKTILSLSEQEGVEPNMYEVIFVVNNPDTIPLKKEGETEENYQLRLEQYHQAVKENQESLELIKIIKNKSTSTAPLNQEEEDIIAKIRDSGLRLHFIDKASTGHTLPPSEANVGGARNRGVAEAVERFYKQLGENGIISQSDADTRFDRNYIKILIETFEARPELIGLTGNIKFEHLGQETELFKKIDTYSELKDLYTSLAMRALKADESSSQEQGGQKADDKVWFSGSNMASRAYETAFVGGVPKINGEEDTRFGWRLEQIGKVDAVKELTVFSADRFSARTDTGHGFIRIKELREAEKGFVANPEAIRFVENTGKLLYEALEQGRISYEYLQNLLQFNGEPLLADEDLHLLNNHLKNFRHRAELMNDKVVESLGAKARTRLQALSLDVPAEQASSDMIKLLCNNDIVEAKYNARVQQLLTEEQEPSNQRLVFLEKLANLVFQNNPQTIDTETILQIMREHKNELELDDDKIEKLEQNKNIFVRFCEAVKDTQSYTEAMDKLKVEFRAELDPKELGKMELTIISLRAMHDVLNDES